MKRKLTMGMVIVVLFLLAGCLSRISNRGGNEQLNVVVEDFNFAQLRQGVWDTVSYGVNVSFPDDGKGGHRLKLETAGNQKVTTVPVPHDS